MALWALLLALVSTEPNAPGTSQAAGAGGFKRLEQLVGEWQGTYAWSGARTDTGPVKASYHLTGNGSALVEELIMNGVPAMTSVYHMDGDELRMTHYCAAHNQPRLRAHTIDLERWQIEFAFVDITNLPAPDAPHVDGLVIGSGAPDQLVLSFQFGAGGKRSVERLSLARVVGRAP